jgi:hypothetical protein
VGHATRIKYLRNSHKNLVKKPEKKRPIGRTRRRWEDKIKMDLKIHMV